MLCVNQLRTPYTVLCHGAMSSHKDGPEINDITEGNDVYLVAYK